MGENLERQGDSEGALTFYRAALGQDGRDAAALERIGQASMKMGNPVRAEQAFRGALAIANGSADAQRGLANALLAQLRVAEALPIFAKLAESSPSPVVLRAYGAALDMAGRQSEAQAIYRRGLELAPTDPNLRGNLALSLALSGQMNAALREMRAALAAPIPDPRQEVNGVLLLAIAGREAEAHEQGLAVLGPARTAAVLSQARRVNAAANPASRAAALGLFTGVERESRQAAGQRQEADQAAGLPRQ